MIYKYDLHFRGILGLLGLAVLLGSLHDAWAGTMTSSDENSIRALRCFSIQANWRSLFSTGTPSDALSCLHGIRVLTTGWIVFSHAGQQIFHRMNYNKSAVADVIPLSIFISTARRLGYFIIFMIGMIFE